MRALISFVVSIIAIALLICIVGWIFATDFFIFDILLWLAVIILQVAVYVGLPILGIIGLLWIFNEIFR
jgi:hypothetical protein